MISLIPCHAQYSESKPFPNLFLGEVVKINSAGKAQVRTCIITSEFLYTCRPGQHTHFRRRISLEGVSKLLLVPSTSDVLVIVPEEYDLRICVNENLDEFISVLKLAFKEQRKTSLEVEIVDEEILLNTIKLSIHVGGSFQWDSAGHYSSLNGSMNFRLPRRIC